MLLNITLRSTNFINFEFYFNIFIQLKKIKKNIK